MKEVIWTGTGDISDIKLGYTGDAFTDTIDGDHFHPEDEDLLEIEISINDSYFSITPQNIDKLRHYCKNPSDVPQDSWIYADPHKINLDPCFRCGSYIEEIGESILLTMWGDNTGLNLLCSDCSNLLYKDLLEVPDSEIVSREI